MYEKLMCMPLFIGLTHNQISNFLEKTPITFSQYQKNDIICQIGDPVNNYSCMIDGEIEIKHVIGLNQELTIAEIIDKPFTLNGDRLFGIQTSSPVQIRATDKTSVMEFSKEQLMNILKSDKIYLLNFLNTVSLKAQVSSSAFISYPDNSFENFISSMIRLYTSKKSRRIEFVYNIYDLSTYLGLEEEKINKRLQILTAEKLIFPTNHGFIINNRSLFI